MGLSMGPERFEGTANSPEEGVLRAAAKSTTPKSPLQQGERINFGVRVSGEVTSPLRRPCFVFDKAGDKSHLAGFVGEF